MFESARFTIDALLRWSAQEAQSVLVLHKGDAHRGLILLQQELGTGASKIWIQETNEIGVRAFRPRHGDHMPAGEAQAFIERELGRDSDLWVVVHERSDGNLPAVLQRA